MCDQLCDRQQEINDFITSCREEYDDYMDVSATRSEEIARKYFGPFRTLTNESVCRMLKIMRASIRDHERHDKIREWKRCCIGVADYLFRPKDLDGEDKEACARALQRFSGWYHAVTFTWSDFQPFAQRIGNLIFARPNVLRYLKIGEEWSFDAGRINNELIQPGGRITLWDFAEGSPNEVRTDTKYADETRTLASRILNFICGEGYKGVSISRDERQEIIERFPGDNPKTLPDNKRDRDRHPLLRWSVDNDFVDLLTKPATVIGDQFLLFLRQRGFNPDKTYKPDGNRRLRWFYSWKVVDDR